MKVKRKKVKKARERKVYEEKDVGLLLEKKKFRAPILKLKRKVYITNDVYKILRREKKEQKKSMAQIACDVIKQTFKKVDE